MRSGFLCRRSAELHSAVADVELIAVGGPVAKVGLKLAEKVGVKALEFVAERGLKSGFCFTAGTQVATPTCLKNIEDIKVGDLVLYAAQTGAIVANPVAGLIRPEPKPTYALVFKGEHGEADTFRATADHPWFTANHRWVHTADLKTGDKIETATGEDFTLVAVKLSGKIERTYNLEVNGLHTFLVGKNHLVVHNSVCNLHGGVTTVENALSKAEDWLGKGYKETKPGIFRSADDARQFRMTNSDITGAHGVDGPHVHFVVAP